MWNKITSTLMAMVMALSMTVATTQQAEARRGVGLGIAAGIIGLGILGAAAHADRYDGPRYYSRYDDGPRGCYRGRRECHWTNRRCFENDYGDYVCRGGRYVCERPLICD